MDNENFKMNELDIEIEKIRNENLDKSDDEIRRRIEAKKEDAEKEAARLDDEIKRRIEAKKIDYYENEKILNLKDDGIIESEKNYVEELDNFNDINYDYSNDEGLHPRRR